MNDINTAKIKQDFPLLFSLVNNFEFGDGWFGLFYDLATELTAIAKKYKVNIVCLEAKQKFGELRFYFKTEDNATALSEIQKAIKSAEVKSLFTCEITGKLGELYVSKNGFYQTLSPDLAKKEDYIKYSEAKEEGLA